ncbi:MULTISPECIES: response regulator transcription factor [Burkholderia cepacia complex]|uniref:response regulator transcription factor n=1 Tax=Burkholderia cepacia complex TaxID=87882 RepID=UPI001EE6FD81|nr:MULTISPECIES: response regulator [Burkholderia cepacia complex]
MREAIAPADAAHATSRCSGLTKFSGSHFMAIVCIIDDDASVRKSLASLLKSAGHTALLFASGEEFLAAGPVDDAACVLVDLKMKGMSGLDVQRLLVQRKATLPFIFMSAHGDDESVRRALAQGAVAFLRKPFPSDDMLNLIDQVASGAPPA